MNSLFTPPPPHLENLNKLFKFSKYLSVTCHTLGLGITLLLVAFYATSCKSIEIQNSSTNPSKLKHYSDDHDHDDSHLDDSRSVTRDSGNFINTFEVKNNYSYGAHCKVFDLVGVFDDKTTHMLVCYADPYQPKTTAVLGLFVDYNGSLGVMFRGDRLKEYIKSKADMFKMDYKFDHEITWTRRWKSYEGSEWAFRISPSFVSLMLLYLSSSHRVVVGIKDKSVFDDFDLVNINGAENAVDHFTHITEDEMARRNSERENATITANRLQRLLSTISYIPEGQRVTDDNSTEHWLK